MFIYYCEDFHIWKRILYGKLKKWNLLKTISLASAAKQSLCVYYPLIQYLYSPKWTKKVSLGIYHTQIRPSYHDIVAMSGQWLDLTGHQGSRHSFWLANYKFGYMYRKVVFIKLVNASWREIYLGIKQKSHCWLCQFHHPNTFAYSLFVAQPIKRQDLH